LQARARSSTSAHRDVIRSRIVLAAAEGATNAGIAATVGVHVDTVRKWRCRFADAGLPGLEDSPRSGRRRAFTPVQVAEVKALACTLPAETGAPLSRWSSADLATEAITRGIAETISAATVRRWLAADVIKPWQHRSWIFPRDPDFAIKAARVLDLYARQWEGRPLGPGDYVLSADEKSQLQALHRRHRGQPPGPGHTRRVEFEYRRGGTLAYFAAYDVHHARVLGQIAPKTGIEPFEQLVAQVMTTEPYASARRVFWVVDNGSSHNGARSIERMYTTWPTATLVHLPVHASWLNQVEIYFSILQRKAINPNDFADLDELSERILSFQDRYNTTATPFDWTYTRDDLNAFLNRLDLHDTPQTRPDAA
ncbi:MAG: IS630 family transposase, partial [Mycobacterium sp.]|nr:IS630 family transposase [Mycobacterium sp.]